MSTIILFELTMKKKYWSRRSFAGLGVMGFSVNALSALSLTPNQTEGPFYPDSSNRFSDDDNDLVKIESEVKKAGGEILHLSGLVLSLSGEPIAGARVEIWQCDVNGQYIADTGSVSKKDQFFQGFGHALTRSTGEYYFKTIRPVPYTGRTPHIHFKVLSSDGKELLTTQMYVSNEPLNEWDGLYKRMDQSARDTVTVDLEKIDGGAYLGRFDLVLDV